MVYFIIYHSKVFVNDIAQKKLKAMLLRRNLYNNEPFSPLKENSTFFNLCTIILQTILLTE